MTNRWRFITKALNSLRTAWYWEFRKPQHEVVAIITISPLFFSIGIPRFRIGKGKRKREVGVLFMLNKLLGFWSNEIIKTSKDLELGFFPLVSWIWKILMNCQWKVNLIILMIITFASRTEVWNKILICMQVLTLKKGRKKKQYQRMKSSE